jgi:cytochrome c biogenesis protein CcdA
MDGQRTEGPADAPESDASRDQTPAAPGDRSRGREGWFATPVIAVIAVVCCAGPLLLGALAATGAGAWLAMHGYSLGAGALVVLAALLVWWIRARLSQG